MKKWIALLMAAAMMLSCLAACGDSDTPDTPSNPSSPSSPSSPSNPSTPSTPSTTPGSEAVKSSISTPDDRIASEQVVKVLYNDEISDWNPLHPSSANTWCNWIDSLVEYDNFGMCQPCLAESWTKETYTYTDDEGNQATGQKWVFKIREGVKWYQQDGTQYGNEFVKAEDWVTTAKWILDPQNTARTADLLFDIQGAEKYYMDMETKEAGGNANPDWDAVGIRAISEYELEFDLMAPCPYFLSRLTYNWGYPTNAKFLEEMGESFGTDNYTILYCGAYLCTTWEQNAYIISDLNPEYWDIGKMHVTRIEERYNAEANTLGPTALLNGEITSCDIPTSQVDSWMNDPQRAALIRPNRPGSYSYWYLINFMPTYDEKTVDGYTLNHEQWLAAANNVNFRKSLYYGLDRVKAVTCYDPYTPENFIIRSITPPNFCAADGKDYTELEPLLPFTSVDQFQSDKALEYRDKAKAELEAAGVKLPIVAYMPYQLDSTQENLSVVVSQQLEELLGTDYIKFILEGYPSTDYLSTTRRAGNYSFMMSYWGPDYADPQTWTDPFALGQAYIYLWRADGMAEETTGDDPDGRMGRSGYDETFWKNSTYDKMVAAASKETVDLSKRYNAFAEVEAWLLDQAVVIPLGTLGGCGYMSSYLNPFESQFAPFGMSDGRYKYQYVMTKPFSTEEFMEYQEKWEAERTERIAAAEAAGIDY